jgi:hypothetical protein
MTTMRAYRDDGPLASWIAERARPTAPAAAPLLTLLGALPLAIVLVVASDARWAAVVAAAWFAALGGAGAPGTERARLGWTVPPLLRLAEYGLLIGLTSAAAPDAMPACFALLGALAFHHYDTVYRLRHQGAEPPRWVRWCGGGWDGRILVATVLAAAGVLDAGLIAGAGALGAVYVTESAMSWRGFVRGARPSVYDDEELEAA